MADKNDSPAEWVLLDALKPWVKNPRRNDANVTRVAESIRRFGFAAPVVARRDDCEIIAGHTRVKAALALRAQWKAAAVAERAAWHPEAVRVAETGRVPTRLMDLSAREAHLLALADNRLNELSPWDPVALHGVMGGYDFADLDVAGWDADALDAMARDSIGDDVPGPADDQTDKAKTDFAVLIECSSESEQLSVLEKIEALGFKARALV